MKACTALCALLVALAGMSTPSAAGIAGSYEGRYQCRDWRALTLRISDLPGGRISAVFIFPVNQPGFAGDGSYTMVGSYDEGTGRFQLSPQQWLRHPPGYNMVGLTGVADSGNRVLHGKIDSVMCGAFELAPHGVALPAVPQPARPVPSQNMTMSVAPQPTRQLPPERQKRVFNLTNYMPDSLEYWDATVDDPNKERESEPIDDVIDWLKSQDFSCLGSQHVSWNAQGTEGTASDRVTVRERYVIECDGNCTGLRYIPLVQATAWHFAATEPVPVMEFKSTWFGGTDIRWKLTRPAGSGKPPEVYIHRWSNAKMLSGQACKAPKTEAH